MRLPRFAFASVLLSILVALPLGQGVFTGELNVRITIEGESFDAADAPCNPDFDGETTHIQAHSWASGGEVVSLPHSGCGVEFFDVNFGQEGGEFRSLRGALGPYDLLALLADPLDLPPILTEFRVFADGRLKATATTITLLKSENTPFEVLLDSKFVGKGHHTVRVEYRILVGAAWVDLRLDYFDFDRGVPSEPVDGEELPGDGGGDDGAGPGDGSPLGDVFECVDETIKDVKMLVDGLADTLIGWDGFPYRFAAFLVDPEGDLQSVEWKWDNGVTQTGTQVVKRFDVAGLHKGILTIVEDSTPRCLGLGKRKVTEIEVVFEAVRELRPQLLDLVGETSCHSLDLLPSWKDFNVVAGACPLRANVLSPGTALDILGDVWFQVDGLRTFEARPSAFEAEYRAADFPDGFHALNACASARSDVHARTFCGPTYEYKDVDCTNEAPSVGGVVGDGLLDGLHGWAEYEYLLEATGVADPDADPVDVLWSLGRATADRQAAFNFDDVGVHTVEVRVLDDPTERCPDLFARESLRSATFEAVPDWQAQLTAPRRGESCVNGQVAPTPPLSPDLVVGRCTAKGRVVGLAGDWAALARGELRLDGVGFHAGAATEISKVFDGLSKSTDTHRVDACFRAAGDKHNRPFCSSAYQFLSVGKDAE